MLVALRSHEEGTNNFLSSDVSPVEAFLFVVSPVGAYLAVKEIIVEKSEKRKRREEKKKEKTYPLFPCLKLLQRKRWSRPLSLL